jgi:hypothetical protein
LMWLPEKYWVRSTDPFLCYLVPLRPKHSPVSVW